ncbi:hypothetical protein [Rhizobium leguminosarum]|uniref:hypothetical protein n=1 Tax=Rhizobium leguminosarum TaxID=384 RepID=UPI0021BBBCF8|nr:hypothetical protein [Rhizobium leguminosarum]
MDAVITAIVAKGYSSETMVRAVRFIGAFIECQNKRNSGEPERLDPADIDQFIASRLAAGAIENGNRIALRRLQNELVRAGVLCPPAEKADPAESTVISLWLDHESTRSTQPYLHAHLAIKEVALAKIDPFNGQLPGQFRDGDELLAFLDKL